MVAAVALLFAASSPVTGATFWTPLAVLAAGAFGLAVYVALAFRAGAVSDTLASAIDRDAGLDGELRSASWFAARDDRDEWADEHLSRAAGRLHAITWTRVYPPAAPGRSGLTTAALTVAAITLAALLPGRGAPAAASTGTGEPGSRDAAYHALEHLPPELLRQLEQLLAAAESGDRAATRALSANVSLRDMLSELAHANDPRLLEALARAAVDAGADQEARDAMEALAERIRRAADAAGMSAAMQDALEQLADELEIATPERSAERGGAPSGDPSDDAAAGGAAGGLEQLRIQFVEEPDTTGGSGVVILSQQGGDDGIDAPGAGVGGAPSGDIPPGTMAGIEAALARDAVEAYQDAPGATVDTEGHRETEQGLAATAYTRGTAAAIDVQPIVAPPSVPEARRAGVRHYFVRPPQ